MFAKSSSRKWNIHVCTNSTWRHLQIQVYNANPDCRRKWAVAYRMNCRHVSKLENSLTIWCIDWTQFVWHCFDLRAFWWVAFYFWYFHVFPSMMFNGNTGECLLHPAVLIAFALPSQVSFGDFSHANPFLCLLNCPKPASDVSNVFAFQQIYL